MSEEIVTVLIGIISSMGTGFAGWFFARRKNAADAKSSELDNTNKAIVIWRETAEELNKQLQEYMHELNSIKELNSQMAEKIQVLTNQVTLMRKENCELKKMVDEVKAMK